MNNSFLKNIGIQLVWVPIWILTNILKRFLNQNHPWKYKKFTLESWCKYGTLEARQISIFFWFQFIFMICFLISR